MNEFYCHPSILQEGDSPLLNAIDEGSIKTDPSFHPESLVATVTPAENCGLSVEKKASVSILVSYNSAVACCQGMYTIRRSG